MLYELPTHGFSINECKEPQANYNNGQPEATVTVQECKQEVTRGIQDDLSIAKRKRCLTEYKPKMRNYT